MRLTIRGTSGLRAVLSWLSTVARQRCPGAASLALSTLAALPAFAFAQAAVIPAESAMETPPVAALSRWDAPEPWRTDRFFLETSLYTRHFDYDPAHDNHQDLLLGEWNVTERWLLGAALFDNSFGQRSQYVYGGYRFRPFEQLQPLYIKISAGLVHGYKGQYQHKIPMNDAGIAPVIVPSVGYCFHRYCSELVIFGNAGVLLTFGVTIP